MKKEDLKIIRAEMRRVVREEFAKQNKRLFEVRPGNKKFLLLTPINFNWNSEVK